MNTKNQVKVTILITTLVSLTLYHLTNTMLPSENNDIFSLYKIAQISLMSAILSFSYFSRHVFKTFFHSIYIHGNYNGISQAYIYDEHHQKLIEEGKELPTVKYKLALSIRQNLFETTISGKSYVGESRDLLSTWEGKLFEIDNFTYLFAIKLTTSKIEYGILNVTIRNGEMNGFYYSGEPRTQAAFSMSATKSP